jgi:endo-1,3(4)-beta-glucanase
MAWSSGGHSFQATSGIGMPFLYFTKSAGTEARVVVNVGSVTVSGEQILIANSQGGARFAVFGPTGSVWTQSGNVYTSSLNGKNYWSMAKLPPAPVAAEAAAEAYRKFAYAFPVNTEVVWNFDEATSAVRTDFYITTEAMEGTSTTILQGLLPHQWGYLAEDSPSPLGYSYPSIRGELKMLEGNHFATARTFHGILPTLPLIPGGSARLQFQDLQQKVALLQHESLSRWTDSYNEGQVLNRLVQTARIADLIGNTVARDQMLDTIRDRLEDWLTAKPGEVAFLFYYNPTWSTLIGYPAGHGQDTNLNDHHFHWGYFIHAAAFVEQFNPGWVQGWGGMIDHLIRDAANPSRTDPQYPFLRNFSPYAGHSWANGFATFPFGNDQESSSESMQFNSSLIHWGELTGNKAVRDLGIYLYITEQTATEEYWFDVNERTLKPEYNYSLVSRIWGNGYDNQTFWTSDIAAAYGIELYPVHAGSLYLGHNLDYATKLWNEMAANTGILTNQPNSNLWHDVYWQFLAFTDPARAIDLYESYPNRSLKFGISDALTYHWIHSMEALGRVDATITADYPIAAAFRKGGQVTYVAHNYHHEALTVRFSDGGELILPPGSMATSRDSSVRGGLTTDFSRAHPGGSVRLDVVLDAGEADRVEFYRGRQLIGETMEAPHRIVASNLSAGVHTFYARLHAGGLFSFTNSVSIQVGDQLPFNGAPWAIPGTIDAGHYDLFEGGLGQGIAYHDNSPSNHGGYRPDEYVDAQWVAGEGATVGWTGRGEWLEYTVSVGKSGVYNLVFRLASGNPQGGGPLRVTMNGLPVTPWISAPSTGGWSSFVNRSVPGVELPAGTHTMRISFDGGDVNLGRMTFAYAGPLSVERPVANAGGNIFVKLPEQTATLTGSASSVAEGLSAIFLWEQIYGPSIIHFTDTSANAPEISNLVEGVYRIRLTVSDGTFEAFDEVTLVVASSDQIPPTVNLVQPAEGFSTRAGRPFTVAASAQDLDGWIASVAFYSGLIRIGQVFEPPYSLEWKAPSGDYLLTAVATDNAGLSATSEPVWITILPPQPCEGLAANGDFSYVFSGGGDQPAMTFIPEVPGVGSQICILYYNKTGTAPFPGYIVTPGVPHPLNNVSAGDTVFFYYTYSHPAGGERNTMNQMGSQVIGSCGEDYVPGTAELLDQWRRAYFPPAVLNDAALEATVWGDRADPAGSGIPNLVRFYLNENPFAFGGSGGPEWEMHGTDLVYRYVRMQGGDVGFGRVEWSNDLRAWFGAGVTETIVESGGGVERVEARLSFESGEPDRVFLRLRVGM